MLQRQQLREQLEDEWRERMQVALLRYRTAKEAVRYARAEYAQGFTPAPDGAFGLQQALRAENVALSEYRRVLIIFNELVISGKMPPDDPGY